MCYVFIGVTCFVVLEVISVLPICRTILFFFLNPYPCPLKHLSPQLQHPPHWSLQGWFFYDEPTSELPSLLVRYVYRPLLKETSTLSSTFPGTPTWCEPLLDHTDFRSSIVPFPMSSTPISPLSGSTSLLLDLSYNG